LRTEQSAVSAQPDTILWPASHETEQEGDHEQNDRDPEDDFGALHCGARDAPEFHLPVSASLSGA